MEITTIVILLIELSVSVIFIIWIMAMLGFADEMNRSKKASIVGKFIVVSCVLIAFVPLLSVVLLGAKYYFYNSEYSRYLLWWLPWSLMFLCALICMGFVYLYKESYKRIK